MILINQIIPLLGCIIDGFGTWIVLFIAFGIICAIPAIVKEVVTYV